MKVYRCQISKMLLLICHRGMKTKTTMKYCYTPVRATSMQNTQDTAECLHLGANTAGGLSL